MLSSDDQYFHLTDLLLLEAGLGVPTMSTLLIATAAIFLEP